MWAALTHMCMQSSQPVIEQVKETESSVSAMFPIKVCVRSCIIATRLNCGSVFITAIPNTLFVLTYGEHFFTSLSPWQMSLEQFEPAINVGKLLDNDRLRAFCRRKGLPEKTLPGDLLTNIGIAQKQ